MSMLRRLRSERDAMDEEIVVACCVRQLFKQRRLAGARGGSVLGREYKDRDIDEGHQRLYRDYFAPKPVYGPWDFRRRYRMQKPVFDRILAACLEYKPRYFERKKDCTGKWGASTIQKLTAALRMLATGKSADSFDAELKMGQSTVLQALHEFTRAVVHKFGPRYARKPTQDDIARILEISEARGFPGMLGSIDCMHWVWEMCPTGWHGQYRGHAHAPTMILEAVAGPDRWIWHSNFGAPGSLNDINVLHRSSLFDDLLTGNAPPVEFTVNGHTYNMGYYLADGIYPNWATIVKGISIPISPEQKLFTTKQAAARKDVECAFGILQKKFGIIKGPCRAWYPEDMRYIMEACIILHNMAIEDERGLQHVLPDVYEASGLVQPQARIHPSIEAIIDKRNKMIDKEVHQQLQDDLMQHIWTKFRPRRGGSRHGTQSG